MTVTLLESRVIILVKALPQPSKTYGETVCCAGVTENGDWKRLFPVRFRHLSGEQSFKRWDWVSFKYRPPTKDARAESCHVFEDTIEIGEPFPEKERERFFNSIIVGSARQAFEAGKSLALIRPRQTKFSYKRKSTEKIQIEKAAYAAAARQESLLDVQLNDLEPSPFEFRFDFEDENGKHSYVDGDWETHAMFYNARKRSSELAALEWMMETFNVRYPKAGMAFAIGNMARRPQTWQLLGVIRLNELTQTDFNF